MFGTINATSLVQLRGDLESITKVDLFHVCSLSKQSFANLTYAEFPYVKELQEADYEDMLE